MSSKKILILAFKISTFCLFFYVLSTLNWSEIVVVLRDLKIHFLLLYVSFFILFYSTKIYRWNLITSEFAQKKSYFISWFINSEALILGYTTPGRLGEILKVLLMEKYQNISRKYGFLIYIFDRLQDIIILGVVSCFGLLYIFYSNSVYLVLILIVMYLVAILYRNKIYKLIKIFFKFEREISTSNQFEFKLLIVNSFIFLFQFSQPYFLAQSMSLNISFFEMSAIYSVGTIIAALPISFSGLGIREMSYIMILNYLNISKESAVTLSLLDNILFQGVFIIIIVAINFIFLKKKASSFLLKK